MCHKAALGISGARAACGIDARLHAWGHSRVHAEADFESKPASRGPGSVSTEMDGPVACMARPSLYTFLKLCSCLPPHPSSSIPQNIKMAQQKYKGTSLDSSLRRQRPEAARARTASPGRVALAASVIPLAALIRGCLLTHLSCRHLPRRFRQEGGTHIVNGCANAQGRARRARDARSHGSS